MQSCLECKHCGLGCKNSLEVSNMNRKTFMERQAEYQELAKNCSSYEELKIEAVNTDNTNT